MNHSINEEENNGKKYRKVKIMGKFSKIYEFQDTERDFFQKV